MGLLFIGTMFIDRLNREFRSRRSCRAPAAVGRSSRAPRSRSLWTPCNRPALGGVLTLAGIQGETLYGAFLLAVYSLGLALPFLLTAVAFTRPPRSPC